MSRHRPSEFLKAREGTTAIEFGFVIWPLLLLLLGTVEFGRLLWTREAVREVAISVARCMGVLQKPCTTSGAIDPVKSAAYVVSLAAGLSAVVPNSGVIVKGNTSCAGVNSSFSQVTINYTFITAVPLFLGALDGVPLTASACFPNQSGT